MYFASAIFFSLLTMAPIMNAQMVNFHKDAQASQGASILHERLSSSLPLLAEDGIVLDKNLSSENSNSKALYFGTGLCTTKEMSAGIPFDYLSLVVTAETIRKTCGFGKVIQLIADSHAKTNHFVSDVEVDKKANEFKELSLKTAHNLGLEGTYKVLLASDFDSSSEYKEIFSSIPPKDIHEYTRKQWTDMEYLARNHNVSLKLSWMMPLKKGKEHRSDEAYFDAGFKTQFQRPYSFIYNRAALTFDPNRLNVCPYTSAKGEKRLLLDINQDAEAKLQEFCAAPHKAKEKALDQTKIIVDFLEQSKRITVPKGSLGSKVNSIIKSTLK